MRPRSGLPRLAMWWLERRLPEAEREFFVGDLVESVAAASDRPALRRARRRVWREAFLCTFRRNCDLESTSFRRGVISDISLDLRIAVRRLRRTPGFTLATSLTLALGIGAACAIVAVARPALWGALPFTHADQIVIIREGSAGRTPSHIGFTTINDLARRVPGLGAVAAGTDAYAILNAPEGSVRLSGMRVTASWFEVMGVSLPFGRGFLPQEDRPGAARVVILTHQAWRTRFAARQDIVGSSVQLNDVAVQVAGVLPASYENVLLPGIEFLLPLRYTDTLPQACRDCRHLIAVGRVRPGTSVQEVSRQVESAFGEMRRLFPDQYERNSIVVTPLRAWMLEGVRGPLVALLGAALLLLLIALANAANLFVARGVQRSGEVALRLSLGASRWRVTRGMLLEAALVSLLGAFFGLALASSAVGTLVAIAPPSMPRIDQVRLEGTTAALALILALVMGLVTGLLPAALTHTRDLRGRISASARSVSPGGRDAVRRGLVVLEMAMALLLLGGAGILVRSVERLLAVDVGFATNERLTMALGVGGPRYTSDTTVFEVWRRLHETVRALPGVTAASLATQLPLTSDRDAYGLSWFPPNERTGAGGDAYRFAVTSDYARTMQLQVRRGRFLEATDRLGTAPVVVISEHVAQREVGDGDPIGLRLRIGGADTPLRTVVGVVNDVQHPTLDATEYGGIYLPLDQNHFADRHLRLIVHSTESHGSLTLRLRAAIAALDPGISVAEVASVVEIVSLTARQRLFARRLFEVFSVSALILAAVGIFALFAGMVGERRQEIAVRSALGASRAQILRHFLLQGLVLAASGVGIGVLGVLALGNALRPLVFGVSPRDPATLLAVSLGLAGIALLATWWPAFRASRVDAADALRGNQ